MRAEPCFSREGLPFPLGASWLSEYEAYNFAVYSKNAISVTLLLFDAQNLMQPVSAHPFRLPDNKTGRIWHQQVPLNESPSALYYAYQVSGPNNPEQGDRFDHEKLLLDPYAKGVFFPPGYSRDAAMRPGSNLGLAPLGVLPSRNPPVVAKVRHELRGCNDLIIYELHVRGYTQNPNSGVSERYRGTFSGLMEKIPYLSRLGITAVELMPIHQFEPSAGNYWGYMTLNFFTPHSGYGVTADPGETLTEFRNLADALHAAGIELLLDVVYNHTAEMGPSGPTYSMRGFDNSSYYLLEQEHLDRYTNNSGCGNDLRTSHPAVRRLVMDSLLYWTRTGKVDGFRFDLASIFARRDDGSIGFVDPPIISQISDDDALVSARLIAEPWDVTTGYMMGRSFPGSTWMQWNDHFRDTVRRFVKGDEGLVPDLMTRLYGSTDLLPDIPVESYRRYQSVNFVSCHDGLTMADLVSYTQVSQNSWNCGYEGRLGAPDEVASLRKRQVKNFCCLLMLSNGTPMLLAGDEFMRSQDGDPNPYNVDNEKSWIDWSLEQQNGDILRFFTMMIAFRKQNPLLGHATGWGGNVTWYGVGPTPDLSTTSHSLAFCLEPGGINSRRIYVMINAFWEDLEFRLQRQDRWLRIVDTSLNSPFDVVDERDAEALQGETYKVSARSITVLTAAAAG